MTQHTSFGAALRSPGAGDLRVVGPWRAVAFAKARLFQASLCAPNPARRACAAGAANLGGHVVLRNGRRLGSGATEQK